jgi:hypothetical protein
MHKIKVRNLKRNEVGKFDPDVSDWRNPYKAVIKFEDLLRLPELAHYDGLDDAVIMTLAEYEALTSGKNWLMPEKSRQSILLAIDALKDSLTEEK